MYGLIVLAIAYIISHFYRSFLAVLSPALGQDLGMTPAQMSDALGAWFVAFALSQFLVGVLLDKIGPKWTTAGLFAVCAGGGGLLFAAAQSVPQIFIAMILLGIGCAPVLMASVYIFKRTYEAKQFAFLMSAFIGVGLLGNILGTSPLAWALEAYGWRAVMVGLSVVTLALSILTVALVKDPPPVQASAQSTGGYLEILKLKEIWFILPIIFFNYPVAAGLRGIWAGPYLELVHGMDALGIGQITLWMALAMAAGGFAYGPADQIFNTRKWVVVVGAVFVVGPLFWWLSRSGVSTGEVTVMLIVIGFFNLYYGILMAQATANIPDHLAGRGVTLINFFNMGGVGVMQWVTSGVYRASENPAEPTAGFDAVLWVYALTFSAALVIYLFSKDVKPKG